MKKPKNLSSILLIVVVVSIALAISIGCLYLAYTNQKAMDSSQLDIDSTLWLVV